MVRRVAEKKFRPRGFWKKKKKCSVNLTLKKFFFCVNHVIKKNSSVNFGKKINIWFGGLPKKKIWFAKICTTPPRWLMVDPLPGVERVHKLYERGNWRHHCSCKDLSKLQHILLICSCYVNHSLITKDSDFTLGPPQRVCANSGSGHLTPYVFPLIFQ